MNVQQFRDPVVVAIHEIRSPLGLVAMAAGVAAEASDNPTVRHQCESIVQTTNRMLRVTSTLFALACDKHNQRPEAYKPAEIAESITGDLAALGARICVEVDPACRDVEVKGFAVEFEGLLQSLLANAFEHGERDCAVRLGVSLADGRLQVRIENTVAESRHHRGIGLGNLIADRLAAELGGTIERSSDRQRYLVVVRIPVGVPGTSSPVYIDVPVAS